MKMIILDDTRNRRNALVNALQKKRIDAAAFYSSNDFITAVEKNKFDLLLLDMESWNRGKAVYNYFRIAKRLLEKLPILFYNADAAFSVLNDRPRHAKDRILCKPTETETVMASLQENR
jgi:PleD family two-component response regulator